MPRLGDAARRDRKSRFIEAARRCAGRGGFHSVTVDDVCAEAGGLSKGAFYTYFSSKEDLLLALLEDERNKRQTLIRALTEADLSEPARAQGFLREVLKRAEDPAQVQVRTDLWSEMVTNRHVQEGLRESVRLQRSQLGGWIEAAAASGQMRPLPATAFASVLIALADGLMLHRALDPAAFRWSTIGRVTDALFEALTEPAEAAKSTRPAGGKRTAAKGKAASRQPGRQGE